VNPRSFIIGLAVGYVLHYAIVSANAKTVNASAA
jgi:hypothetical protein